MEVIWVTVDKAHLFKNKEIAVSVAQKYECKVQKCFIIAKEDLDSVDTLKHKVHSEQIKLQKQVIAARQSGDYRSECIRSAELKAWLEIGGLLKDIVFVEDIL
jgi:hypothetical protein